MLVFVHWTLNEGSKMFFSVNSRRNTFSPPIREYERWIMGRKVQVSHVTAAAVINSLYTATFSGIRQRDSLVLRCCQCHCSFFHSSVLCGHRCCNSPGPLWWRTPCTRQTSWHRTARWYFQTGCGTDSSTASKPLGPGEGMDRWSQWTCSINNTISTFLTFNNSRFKI